MVALLGFGYRLALHIYQHGLTGFLGQVTKLVVDVMLRHCIARWIAQRGGWVSAQASAASSPLLGLPLSQPHPGPGVPVCAVSPSISVSWQVAALNLGNGPIVNVLIVLSVVLLGQFVVRRFFKS